MRLLRLNLTRYGKFTDFFFDFGSTEPGVPDFHVIYGPNEAGKTTTLTAFLDLLFGIDKNNPYHFLHDAMEVGGVLQFAGGVREFRRIKKQNGSLLDAMGQPVPDGAILDEIGGLGRADYKLKFSLDADTLEKGGENIIASKGDLGQLLFAASAGVLDLSMKLEGLREECDQFFRKRAHKTELAELKKQLDQLAEQKGQIDTLVKVYRKLLDDSREAEERYRKALNERTKALADKSELENLEGALPRLETLKDISTKLAALENIPLVPPGLKEQVTQLQAREIRLEADLENVVSDIRELTEKIESIVVDEKALAVSERLPTIWELKSRFNGAVLDIPKLKPQVQKLSEDIAGILHEIGRKGEEDPKALLLDASVIVPLRDLIKSESGVLALLESARKEWSDAEKELEEESGKLSSLQTRAGAGDSASLKILASIAADIRRASLDNARVVAAKALKAWREILADKMKPLAPWRGGSDDLASIRLPDAAQIERWKTKIDAAENALNDQKSVVARLTNELSELCAQRDALAVTAGVISDGEATQRRADREWAWAEHRRELSAGTADAFEGKMRRDDLAVSARFSHVSEIVKVNRTLEDIEVKERGLRRAEELLEEANHGLEDARNEVAASIRAVSSDFLGTMTPAEFAGWALQFRDAAGARDEVMKAERALGEAEDDLTLAVEKLATTMEKAGVSQDRSAGLDAMLLLSEAAIDEAKSLQMRVEAVDSAKRALAKRVAERDEAQREIDRWKGQWIQAVGSCWIGETHKNPTTSLVSEILSKLVELKSALSDRTTLEGRIDKMERDKKAFETDVQSLAVDMGEDSKNRPTLALFEELEARVKLAKEHNLILSEKKTDLETSKVKQITHIDLIEDHRKGRQGVLEQLDVKTLAEAAVRLDEAKTKADLLARKAEEEGHMLKALGVATLEDAEAVLEKIDLAALSTEKAAAENRFKDADGRQMQHFSEKAKYEEQLAAIGGDDAVALIEEKRRTVCLEIEDKAKRWLRMRAGIVAAEQALRIYREKHRSSMLANASEAFATISRRAYSKLATVPDGASETLVGVVANGGGSRLAREMSKGTRFQLYLALRVAGYQEYVNCRQPPSGVPFVADDIMETFDDERAEEAFGLLAKMAEVGQVIYLTHHEHLCAIAQKVCPHVRLHRFA
ncbi:AAA family ATPase [Methylocystis echinoides]|uniref:AAA family ATPase n=1 Tax=Methylocystis echinoides TaxID=29468 RepID=UPI003424B827